MSPSRMADPPLIVNHHTIILTSVLRPIPSTLQHTKQTTMEEEATATTNPSIQDTTIQKKHQTMLNRLSTRHQTRLDISQTRKSDSPTTSSPLESTSSFLSLFSSLKHSIDSQLTTTTTTTDPTHLKSHLANISSSISDLEKLVADNSYFLPSYELRSSLKTISDLKQNLETLNPKKKFSFKNKPNPKKQTLTTKATKSDAVSKPNPIIRDSPGFRNKQSQVLVKDFKSLDVGEFTLSDLDSCEVKLIGCVNALFVNRLRNSRVYVGPVMGSVLIEEVENCVFVMASHQIRIHYAKRSDFYVRVRSRPIIEDSCEVRFAPYCLEYEGIEEDLKKAGLDEETANWGNVDDFKWLRAVQSPNWSVLPEDQRVGSVEVSGFEGGNEVDC